MKTVKTPYGSLPVRTSCVANANGYGQHETDLEPNAPVLMNIIVGAKVAVTLLVCKHCGSLYGKVPSL